MSQPSSLPSATFASVTGVWTPAHYANPEAPVSQTAVALGQQLALALFHLQGLCVFDHRAKQTSFVSTGVERLLGYSAEEFTTDFHYSQIHPDDAPIVTEATRLLNQYIIERLDNPLTGMVFSVDYRLRHAQGHWLRVLRQSFILEREPNGAMIAAAAILTDITAHKVTNDVRFHVNRPDFAAFVRHAQRKALPTALSAREQEIAVMVVEGMTSRQIAERLFLSTATVQKHRKNIRHKVGSQSIHHLLQHLDERP
ncbi:LuxR C-terminal-related transcriptional regulator [Hymenobacter rubidus]|uniref:LuxR C-terminal-related transcriptional regulator n=1 Tax=Hymenobacter rubidus TaxID=1441626 RepID=UPI00192007EC|nr:LuxR C-terminal-related transcriptional regulator [Hymenobacter rubidus]